MIRDLQFQIALTLVPQIGDVQARTLIQHFGSAEAVFKAPRRQLESVEGIGTVRAKSIKEFNRFDLCDSEIQFIEKYKIQALGITDKQYPQRLLNCYDCPVLLYYRGTANLNAPKIVSIVGTRNQTEYGRQFTETLVRELAEHHVLIVSGLAFGIDTIAHKAALKNNLETVGVLAHGLDRIYPQQNKTLAKHMTDQGGLLTDFKSDTNPDKQNFPKRNRIVAGICDALVVIESDIKGGSLITAELANSYNKDVFAVPGKTTDVKSTGCNYLIRQNKASLISSATNLVDMMNWAPKQPAKKIIQRELFPELSAEEQRVIDVLAVRDSMHVDDLYLQTGLSSSTMAQALLMLEMKQVILSMPGKIYRLA